MASLVVIRRRLERNTERLELYYEAERAILDGAQSYTIGTRSLTRANLAEITDMIAALETTVAEDEAALEAGGRGGRRRSVGVYLRDW